MRKFLFGTLLMAMMALVVLPAAAQEESPAYPADTITVTGIGEASGTPDLARVIVGVEIQSQDLAMAFEQSNSQIDSVINAVVEAGVAREDVRTTNLNVFINRGMQPPPGPEASGMTQSGDTYNVSNQIRLVVRDVDNVAGVINAAVAAGANNIFGLEFGIEDQDALQSDARADAFADARGDAEELAQLAGVTLGEVVLIQEGGSPAFGPMNMSFAEMGRGGGGGATIEPGQLTVNSTVTVTFAINR
jgi:uncharacterized protein